MAPDFLRVKGIHVAFIAHRGPDVIRVGGEDLCGVDAFEPTHPLWHVFVELRREVVDAFADVVAGEKVVRVRGLLAEGSEVCEVAALVLRDHDPRVSSKVASKVLVALVKVGSKEEGRALLLDPRRPLAPLELIDNVIEVVLVHAGSGPNSKTLHHRGLHWRSVVWAPCALGV